MGMGIGTKIVGWGHILQGCRGDGDKAGGDGSAMGANPVGKGWGWR